MKSVDQYCPEQHLGICDNYQLLHLSALSHSSASPGLQGNLRAGQDMGKVWGDYKDGCAMSGANGTHLSLRSLCAPLKPLQHEAHLWSMSCVTSYVTADLLEFK